MSRMLKALRDSDFITDMRKRLLPQSSGRIAHDSQAFWSRSAEFSDIRDLSHWQGEGRWHNDNAWHQVGETHFAMYENLCFMATVSRPMTTMVEWGPGGGANAIKFISEVEKIYGVDISPANLAECGRQVEARKSGSFIPIQIEAIQPESALDQLEKRVDFFLSTAVFQHFPSKDYGVKVTEIACQMLKNDGIAIIQTRYDDGSKALMSRNRDYDQHAVTFTAYSIHEFWQITIDCGFTPLAIILDAAPCYAYYLLSKDSHDP